MKTGSLIAALSITIAALSAVESLPAQPLLTLETCQQEAQQNYPLVKRYGLIDRSERYDLQNAGRGYLPQLSLSAKASYQSDVTQIDISLPGVEIPSLPKDQYQAVLELNQVIWDGGAIRSRQRTSSASAEVDRSQQQVDMYALRERVNSLYFGILLLEEQLRLNALYEEELERNLKKVEECVTNGVANRQDVDEVQVALLTNRQRRIEAEATRDAYRRMLEAFVGRSLEGCPLQRPLAEEAVLQTQQIDRPELALFTAQSRLLDAQGTSIATKSRPRLSAFVQGGYGRPSLNMFALNFKPYALGGVRLSWNFGGYYTKYGELQKIGLARNNVELQRETFLFNTRQQIASQDGELEKYRRTLCEDDRIVELRGNIARASQVKMTEGTLSVSDYLDDLSATEQARQSRAIHEMESLKTYYSLKNLINR